MYRQPSVRVKRPENAHLFLRYDNQPEIHEPPRKCDTRTRPPREIRALGQAGIDGGGAAEAIRAVPRKKSPRIGKQRLLTLLEIRNIFYFEPVIRHRYEQLDGRSERDFVTRFEALDAGRYERKGRHFLSSFALRALVPVERYPATGVLTGARHDGKDILTPVVMSSHSCHDERILVVEQAHRCRFPVVTFERWHFRSRLVGHAVGIDVSTTKGGSRLLSYLSTVQTPFTDMACASIPWFLKPD